MKIPKIPLLANPIPLSGLHALIDHTMMSTPYRIRANVWHQGHDEPVVDYGWEIEYRRKHAGGVCPHSKSGVKASFETWKRKALVHQFYHLAPGNYDAEVDALFDEFDHSKYDNVSIEVGRISMSSRSKNYRESAHVVSVSLFDQAQAAVFKLKYPLSR